MKKAINHLVDKIPSRHIFRFFFNRKKHSNAGFIMALHRVTAPGEVTAGSLNDFIEISALNLESTICRLSELGVQFLSLQEVKEVIEGKRAVTDPIVHVSFDDGYKDNYTVAFPILQKYNIPFSLFICSDFIGNEKPFLWWYMIGAILAAHIPVDMPAFNFQVTEADYKQAHLSELFTRFRSLVIDHVDQHRDYFETELNRLVSRVEGFRFPAMLDWPDIQAMQASGLCELGIHTKTHPRFRNISREQVKEEIATCSEMIHKHTGVTSRYFAFAYGAAEDIGSTDGLAQLLEEAGIEMAFTTVPGELNKSVHPYFMPRIIINNAATAYTLKSRLSGNYQRYVGGIVPIVVAVS